MASKIILSDNVKVLEIIRHIDLLQWGSQLLQTEQVRDYPKMIKEVDPQEWQKFFIEEARKMKDDITE